MYKLTFYVPESHLSLVKEAVFSAGAGKLGDYEHCCWQSLGEGQFRPLANSQPFIGERGRLEVVPEYKVELLCDKPHIHAVIRTLKAAHPYEEPAYDVVELLDI